MPPPANGFVARVIVGPALRAQPDGRLVALVREGYESAFEEIVRRYGHPLRRYAAAIVGGSADDVTQDALSKAFLALRRDDREIELRPWLYRILRNTALNDLRDRPPRTTELSDALEGRRGVAEEVERREEIDELLGRLQALPEPQRAAIVMRELEGLGHEEIASALGISGGAARQTIHRARTALRDGLGMAIPLPLLKLMLEGGGPSTAEIAAGSAGAGVVLKAATATVLVAGTIGASVALHNDGRGTPKPADRAIAGNATKGFRRLAATPGGSAGTTSHDYRAAQGGDPSGREHNPGHEGSGPIDGGSTHSGSHNSSEGGSSVPRGGGGHDDAGGTSGGGRSGNGDSSSGDGASGESIDSGSGSGASPGGGEDGGEISSSGEGSESNSGPDSGGEEGSPSTESTESRDSGDGEGFSGQMETRTTEEDR